MMSPSGSAVRERLPAGIERVLVTAGPVVTLTGLVLGSVYGDGIGSLPALGAVALGTSMYWQVGPLRGRDAYGGLVVATVAGPLLAALVSSILLSAWLSIPFSNVLLGTAVDILLNATVLFVFIYVGIATAGLLSSLGPDLDRRRAFALLALSVGGFLALSARVEALAPASGPMSAAIRSGPAVTAFRLSLLGLVAAGAAALVALRPLVASATGIRWLVIGLVVSGALIGGASLGEVHADISRAKTVERVEETVSVRPVGIELGERTLRVRVRITNPTDRRLTADGLFVMATDRNGSRLVFTPASTPDGTLSIPPNESVAITYPVPLARERFEGLRHARNQGPVVVEGIQTIELDYVDFEVRFQCVWTDEGCVNATAG